MYSALIKFLEKNKGLLHACGGLEQTLVSIESVLRYKSASYQTIDQLPIPEGSTDEIFILGSGPSINDINAEHWNYIQSRLSIGLNKFMTHPFVPDYYFVQPIHKATETFYRLYLKRAKDYKNTIFIARGDAVNHLKFHLDPGCNRILKDYNKQTYIAPEIFIPSYTKINPLIILDKLKENNLVSFKKMPLILPKFGATLPLIHLFAAFLGCKKIILCGIDMTDYTFFYDPQYNAEVFERFEGTKGYKPVHPHVNTEIRRFTVTDILVSQAKYIKQLWDVDTYCLGHKSVLSSKLPVYSWADS